MTTLHAQKCYAISRRPMSGRDLSVTHYGQHVLWIIFHTSRITSNSSLVIHEKTMSGDILCTATLNSANEFAVRLGARDQKTGRSLEYHMQESQGSTVWDHAYKFRLSRNMTLAWKRTREGEFTIPTDGMGSERAVRTGRGDWKLVSTKDRDVSEEDEFEAGGEDERVLAVYSTDGPGKGVFQMARVFWMEQLPSEVELGSLAAIMGLVRWDKTRGRKFAWGSGLTAAPASMG